MTIKELMVESHSTAIDHGWWPKDRDMGEILANVHAEVSEAWEEYRRSNDVRDLRRIMFDGSKPCGFPIELADILIRVADLAEAFDIDLEYALRTKMDHNKTRPYRHGGLRA